MYSLQSKEEKQAEKIKTFWVYFSLFFIVIAVGTGYALSCIYSIIWASYLTLGILLLITLIIGAGVFFSLNQINKGM